jgi:hypothetical protein
VVVKGEMICLRLYVFCGMFMGVKKEFVSLIKCLLEFVIRILLEF